ncbi:hypothetical protein V6N12_025638 [Hibiscus sabdariffa]|uniref:Retrotransposon gag domain-containing protein n=1 Tax=Hibiscus sabdariffa TaxID=183260 RepID=A0ABR2CJ09_9ROSI
MSETRLARDDESPRGSSNEGDSVGMRINPPKQAEPRDPVQPREPTQAQQNPPKIQVVQRECLVSMKEMFDQLVSNLKQDHPIAQVTAAPSRAPIDKLAQHQAYTFVATVMFNMLNTLGQFGGSPAENARQHLKSFLEICNSFKIHGVSNDVLKLKLFPYSLRDKAKDWFNNLPPGSFQSWTELC